MEFEDKIHALFIREAVEDEEDVGVIDPPMLPPVHTDTVEAPDIKDEGEEEHEEYETTVDWTGIPNAKPGKTLNDLKGVRKPLENGWTKEELISALKPTMIFFANKYQAPTISKVDLIQDQAMALDDAIRNDGGIAQFTSYVYPWFKSAAMRAAGKASNISGVQQTYVDPKTGKRKYDFLAGARASVSADAPVGDDTDDTFADTIPSTYDQGSNEEKRRQLINKMLDDPSIGLSDREKMLIKITFGLSKLKDVQGDAATTSKLSEILGVSSVRLSQIRKRALEKIQEYLDKRGIGSIEQAFEKYGLEEAKLVAGAMIVIESMKEIVAMECEILSENCNIPYELNGRRTTIKIKSGEIVDAKNEFGESVLGKLNGDNVNEINEMIQSRKSEQFFVEMVGHVLGIQSQPVLAVIDGFKNPEIEEVKEDEMIESLISKYIDKLIIKESDEAANFDVKLELEKLMNEYPEKVGEMNQWMAENGIDSNKLENAVGVEDTEDAEDAEDAEDKKGLRNDAGEWDDDAVIELSHQEDEREPRDFEDGPEWMDESKDIKEGLWGDIKSGVKSGIKAGKESYKRSRAKSIIAKYTKKVNNVLETLKGSKGITRAIDEIRSSINKIDEFSNSLENSGYKSDELSALFEKSKTGLNNLLRILGNFAGNDVEEPVKDELVKDKIVDEEEPTEF
jgi:RNA polymerase sigma factor (sigma-70 family)